ncbi:MAG TPA: cyclase family protein [Candidatus Sulfotelmatobacter sp.]|nr:cyclase family protein [Candidatus Sulfotelmatobacter sp.]
MKTRALVIGYALALTLLLFAQRHTTPAQGRAFNNVIDLTHASDVRDAEVSRATASADGNDPIRRGFATRIEAPSHLARGLWTVDQIPAERLKAPLVVLDVRDEAERDSDYQISVDDIADWEKANGQVPQGAVVVARTGWEPRRDSASELQTANRTAAVRFPGYSEEAARFLVDGRNVIGLGIDAPSVDNGSPGTQRVRDYTLAHSLYHLDNLAHLDRVPASGATVVVAPLKLSGGSAAPVRVLAMTK